MTGSLYDAVFGDDLPEAPALVSQERTWSYPELAELIDDVAAQLHLRGIRERHTVGIQLDNGIDFAAVFHAVLRLGAVAVPLPAHVVGTERAGMLNSVSAKLLVRAEDMPGLMRARGAGVTPIPDIDPEQLACLPFSSGTTGTPKAVMLPHRALAANVKQFAEVLPLASGETCLSVLPFSHIYGLTALLNVPLSKRARIVAQPYERQSFLDAHTGHRVNMTFIAPPLARVMLDSDADFSALHTIISGAAPLDPAVASRLENTVGAKVRQGFGLTETSPVTHLAWQDNTDIASIGHPLPGTSISVRDPETLAETDEGEMWVRGPQVMAGYLGDPDATARTLIDGWLRTGDLVRRNPDGSFTVVDRLKDLIKSHGFQVSPVKLEHIIMQLTGVSDAAVTRGYGRDGEEQPEAFVVSSQVTEAEIMDFVASQVAGFEKIRAVHLIDRIPRSASGKILRRQLRTNPGH